MSDAVRRLDTYATLVGFKRKAVLEALEELAEYGEKLAKAARDVARELEGQS